MMKMKLNKKIAGASAMLMLSATMLGTSTFAWFTMNKEVTVTGMSMKTTVGSNLLVSPDTTEANFKPALTQTRSAMLEPVSTIDGVSFDYTVNASANGAALADATFATYNESASKENTYAAKTMYDPAFNNKYGITVGDAAAYSPAYGYIDYAFYLKATNTETSTTTIDMTKCNLLYNGAAVSEKSWRAAMFVQDLGGTCTAGVAPGAQGGAALVTILTPDEAANQEANKARNSSHTLAGVTYNDAAQVEDAIAVNATNYYYVVVRVWLEGEDTTCTSATYANLTDAWTLDLEFAIAGGESGTKSAVTEIESTPAP